MPYYLFSMIFKGRKETNFNSPVYLFQGNYRLSPAVYGHLTCMLKGLAHGKVILALEV